MVVPSCTPTVTVAPAMGTSGLAFFSTTFTGTARSVRSFGFISPFASTVTGTSSFRVSPSTVAVTVTFPSVGTGTLGSVTLPSPSVSVSVYDFPSLSTRVTVAPGFTPTSTGSNAFFSSSITPGFAWPAASTVSFTPVLERYPVLMAATPV